LAPIILERISELFAIEADIKGQKPEQRLNVRQEQSVPRPAKLKILLDTTLNKISGRSILAEAIRYTSIRWIAMTRYTTDGRQEMTNNAAERAERPHSHWPQKQLTLTLLATATPKISLRCPTASLLYRTPNAHPAKNDFILRKKRAHYINAPRPNWRHGRRRR
jgi:hypothetical protein